MSPLKQAYDAKRRAQLEFERVVKSECAIGTLLQWVRGGHRQNGYVLSHGYDDRLFVENIRTGAKLWITAFDVLQAEKSEKPR